VRPAYPARLLHRDPALGRASPPEALARPRPLRPGAFRAGPGRGPPVLRIYPVRRRAAGLRRRLARHDRDPDRDGGTGTAPALPTGAGPEYRTDRLVHLAAEARDPDDRRAAVRRRERRIEARIIGRTGMTRSWIHFTRGRFVRQARVGLG